MPILTGKISAYKDLLGCLFHEPFDTSETSSELASATLHFVRLVNIAELYDLVHVIADAVENHFIRYYGIKIAEEWVGPCQGLLHIATKIKSRWLFREVACRWIGDSFERNHCHNFPDIEIDEAENILETKQNELDQLMSKIDKSLLTLTKPRNHRKCSAMAATHATAVFRADVVKCLNHYDYIGNREGACYSKYLELKGLCTTTWAIGSWKLKLAKGPFQRLERDFGEAAVEAEDFAHAYFLLQVRADKIIAPLLKEFVAPPVSKGKGGQKRGLLCMNINDNDLPWMNNAVSPNAPATNKRKRQHMMEEADEESEGSTLDL
ncbi:MAG: hypothetical protein Q9164_004710 [Protoblastenia rupestris]